MNQGIRKRLRLERLEERQCFSVDIGAILAELDVPANVIGLVRHNYDQPTDVNVDGRTTPSDALNVINELNSKSAAVSTVASINSSMMTDTNGDKRVTPADALIVINHLNNRIADVEIPTEKALSTDETEQTSQGVAGSSLQISGSTFTAVSSLKVDTALLWGSTTMDTVLLSRDVELIKKLGQTYAPTDDIGNGFFRSDDEAQPIKDTIEAELRKQLKLDDSALIQVAIFVGVDEVQSGTWKYVTDEGTTIWGNWRQTPDELRLSLSNAILLLT